MNAPSDRFYSKEHEWAKLEGNVAVVGISDHAQDALGDIVFVELPKVGAVFHQMQEFGVVESVKTVSTLYCPFSGKVIEINSDLQAHPEVINSDPYEKGWIMKLEASNPAEKNSLLSAKDYETFLGEAKK